MYIKKTVIIASLITIFAKSFAACNVTLNTGVSFDPNICQGVNVQKCNVLGQISLLCSSTTTLSMNLSPGNANQFNPRVLTNEHGDKVFYNIYIDANHTTIFGDGSQNTSVISGTCNANAPCSFNIYGAILSNIKKAGSYSDSTSLTISY